LLRIVGGDNSNENGLDDSGGDGEKVRSDRQKNRRKVGDNISDHLQAVDGAVHVDADGGDDDDQKDGPADDDDSDDDDPDGTHT
jgi:hypothetical protein